MIFKWRMPFTAAAAFARGVWAKLRGYEVLATREEQCQREMICEECPFFDGFQCDACGCIVVAKTSITTEKCPKGKWGRIWRKKEIARQA